MKIRKKMGLALGAILALTASATQSSWANTTADLDLNVTFNGQLSVAVDGNTGSTVALYGYSASATTAGNPGANAYAAPNDSDTVTNDGSIVERWEVDASTQSGGGNWELTDATGTATPANNSLAQIACQGTCPTANQYAIQALFVSSNTAAGAYGTSNGCPYLTASDWNGNVSTVPAHVGFGSAAANPTEDFAVYTSTELADPNAVLGVNGNPDSSNPLLTGQTTSGDMLPQNDQVAGTGKRGLCVRVTMPSATTVTIQQEIQLEITAIGG